MRRAGVAESVIMSITGHSTRTMFDRYNTIAVEDAQNAIGQQGPDLGEIDQNVDQEGLKQ